MSLAQINDYGVGDVNLTSLMETLDRQRRGYQALSLTHYDDNLEPKIAAGSIVELGGALFKTEADESITGWAGIGNDNDVYVKLVPSGATATAAFVTAAPTWSTSKQGWYVGNDRYVGGLYKDGSGNYTIKWLYTPEDTQNLLREGKTRPILEKVIEIGDWNMNVSGAGITFVLVSHNIAYHGKIRAISVIIRDDNDVKYHVVPDLSTSTVNETPGAGVNECTSTVIKVRVETTGPFDIASYSSTGYNRGWIYIKYQA